MNSTSTRTFLTGTKYPKGSKYQKQEKKITVSSKYLL